MHLQRDRFSSACDNFGLTISTKKTGVMFQPAPHIQVNGQTLQAVETFTYLGSTLSCNATIDAVINNRISKASTAFGRLRKNVWERRGIGITTKLKVYRAVVLTTLAAKLGLHTEGTSGRSATSIFGVSVISFTSAGRTKFQTKRC